MFIHYRTSGIILKKVDRGEADQLFSIYTKDFGKLEILGKAIRKISSKLRSSADIFSLSEIEFIQGKTYKILTDALLILKFGNLKRDLKKLFIAHKMADILDNLVKDQEPDEKIWNLLNEVFRKLNNLPLATIHWSLLYYYFLWNLISFLGYQPEIYFCLFCQKKLLPKNLYFSPQEGGILCPTCQEKFSKDQFLKIKPETVKILRIILKRNLALLTSLKMEKKFFFELKIISQNYLHFLFNETLK